MSNLDLPNLELKESGITNEDGAQLILQCEAWFQARIDLLNETAEHMKKAETVDLNGTEITDPKVIKGMRYGFLTAVSLLGKFPLKLGGLAETE
jgi:hypothetical protein